MPKLSTLSGRPPHSAVPALCDQVATGEIDRRDFLRTVAWLGVTATSARAFLGGLAGGAALLPGAAEAQATPKRGGTLRFACQIQEMTDPSAVSWIAPTNLFRNSLEFLTLVDADNITQPYLATSWEPSEDLMTWRFKLQPNVKWSNGDDFTSADVAATIKRWLSPESKSVNKTAFAAITQVDATGPLEFTLQLSKPLLTIPEMLYAYTCPIVHRDFVAGGADWPKNPIGTGPYTMTEYLVGQRATFKRREGYWGTAPFLDEIRYIDMGTDQSTQVAALAAGQVDILYRIGFAEVDLVKRIPTAQVLTTRAAQTICMRMQVDQKPFDDLRVRKAILLCADNQQMVDLAVRGLGIPGENHHVAPFQPEYYKLPPVKRDVAQAKQLMKDAGYPNGFDTELTVGNTSGTYEQNAAQILQQNCAEIGVRIKLNVLPPAAFWPIWTKVAFGLTYWVHRPLAVMTLDLAYRSGAVWNESHYANKAFDDALDHAMTIIDPKKRSEAMMAVEKILQDDCVMVQPFWADKFTAISTKVKGYRLHPAEYYDIRTTWLA